MAGDGARYRRSTIQYMIVQYKQYSTQNTIQYNTNLIKGGRMEFKLEHAIHLTTLLPDLPPCKGKLMANYTP
jgi:hypothetical protein